MDVELSTHSNVQNMPYGRRAGPWGQRPRRCPSPVTNLTPGTRSNDTRSGEHERAERRAALQGKTEEAEEENGMSPWHAELARTWRPPVGLAPWPGLVALGPGAARPVTAAGQPGYPVSLCAAAAGCVVHHTWRRVPSPDALRQTRLQLFPWWNVLRDGKYRWHSSFLSRCVFLLLLFSSP
jgi:hypothetical protein